MDSFYAKQLRFNLRFFMAGVLGAFVTFLCVHYGHGYFGERTQLLMLLVLFCFSVLALTGLASMVGLFAESKLEVLVRRQIIKERGGCGKSS